MSDKFKGSQITTNFIFHFRELPLVTITKVNEKTKLLYRYFSIAIIEIPYGDQKTKTWKAQ